MGVAGSYEFVKWFYPQSRKEGLIVDVRANGGGNISQWIIERLRRKLARHALRRTVEDARTYPDVVMRGPMVCLLNETSASDGDIFPYMFREAGLGPADRQALPGAASSGITGRARSSTAAASPCPRTARTTRKGGRSSRATASTPTSRSTTTPPR